jgi:NAD(P)H dehydrogenase (quinone)
VTGGRRQRRRVLVVVAHPCTDSLTRAAAAAAEDGARRAGHHVELVDLYADGSRVAMTYDERLAYHGDEPLLDPLAARYAELVRSSDVLVFVYPTWWSGPPAILKGWLERVLVRGVAFDFHPKTGKVVPRLRHVRRIVGISTYGSRRLYVKAINDNGRRIFVRALRMSCGVRARTTWLALYGVDSSTADDRTRFLERVERRMAGL